MTDKLKGMFIYTAITTIPFGLSIILMPGLWFSLTDLSIQNQYIFGIVGSVWLAFGTCAILGLKNPIKFITILLLQLIYKIVWVFLIFIPQLFFSGPSIISLLLLITFLTFIIPDIFIIPWNDLLKKD
jgi:hypothetical protein